MCLITSEYGIICMTLPPCCACMLTCMGYSSHCESVCYDNRPWMIINLLNF